MHITVAVSPACFVAFMYRYQISVSCLVAMETLDPHLCGVAMKRAVQRLSEYVGDDLLKQEDQLMKDVLKLLQLMYSKVGLIVINSAQREDGEKGEGRREGERQKQRGSVKDREREKGEREIPLLLLSVGRTIGSGAPW